MAKVTPEKTDGFCSLCEKRDAVAGKGKCIPCLSFTDYVNANLESLNKMAEEKGLKLTGTLVVGK